MRHRAPLVLLLLVCALAAAACGSSSKHARAAGSALSSELSYFPAGDPLLLSLQTSPSAPAVQAANQLLDRIPLVPTGEAALKAKLSSFGVNYDTDIKPLLGQPALLGFATAQPGGASTRDVLIVLDASSATKLDSLVRKLRLPQSGSYDGARLYSASGVTFALQGATILLGKPASIDAALARHAHGSGGFSPAEFARLTSGLPAGGLIMIAGELSGVLSRPSAAQARKVPWVAAIKGYGVSLSSTSIGLALSFRVDTSAATLSASQLPLAAGAGTPGLLAGEPVQIGLTGAGQTLAFIEQASGGKPFAGLPSARATAAKRLLAQLSGSTALDTNGHATMLRAAVADPAKARGPFRQLISAEHGSQVAGGGFYRFTATHGGTTYVRLSGSQLLIGHGVSLPALEAFASASVTPATGAHGPLAFRIALPQLLALVLRHRPSAVAALILSQLGELSGWASNSAAALTGQATLSLK